MCRELFNRVTAATVAITSSGTAGMRSASGMERSSLYAPPVTRHSSSSTRYRDASRDTASMARPIDPAHAWNRERAGGACRRSDERFFLDRWFPFTESAA